MPYHDTENLATLSQMACHSFSLRWLVRITTLASIPNGLPIDTLATYFQPCYLSTTQVPSHAHHTHFHFNQSTHEYATRPSHAPSVNTRMREVCIPQFRELRMHTHGFPFRVPSPRPSVPGLTRSSVVQVPSSNCCRYYALLIV
jgi:hypothetical protein